MQFNFSHIYTCSHRATGVKQARYRRGPTRGSEALVRACAVYTCTIYNYCVYGRSLALAVQCETTHGVYEIRRGFCTLVLSFFTVLVLYIHTPKVFIMYAISQVEVSVYVTAVKDVSVSVTVGLPLSLERNTLVLTVAVILTTAIVGSTLGLVGREGRREGEK